MKFNFTSRILANSLLFCLIIIYVKALPRLLSDTNDAVSYTLPEAKLFDQDIDHTSTSGGTFKQLYYESLCEEGDENDNLKFLLIGGENALSSGSVAMNYMSQLADQFLADKYALEHRYYGQSQPFRNITTESLKHLTIDQAIDDIINFIQFINSKTPEIHTRWILFGGGYAGNLAVWARLKFPEVVFGAVASSAPVQIQLNFKEYLQGISDIIHKKDESCNNIIKQAMNNLVHTFSKPEGKDKLKTQFKMCKEPKDQFDKFSLTSYIMDIFSDAVEYNTLAINSDRISLLCNDLKNREGDHLEKLISLVVDHYLVGSKCFNYNYDSKKDLFNSQINEYNFERQWYYQKCTGLGQFRTTGSNNQPFAHSLPLMYYTRMCKDAFGNNFGENMVEASVARTNSKYNGKDVEGVSNVIMVHGSSDPWNGLGIMKFTTNNSKAIIIKDGWHCQDMIMASNSDPEELKQSRLEINNAIEHWVAQ